MADCRHFEPQNRRISVSIRPIVTKNDNLLLRCVESEIKFQ